MHDSDAGDDGRRDSLATAYRCATRCTRIARGGGRPLSDADSTDSICVPKLRLPRAWLYQKAKPGELAP